jgi:hypothetical protein
MIRVSLIANPSEETVDVWPFPVRGSCEGTCTSAGEAPDPTTTTHVPPGSMRWDGRAASSVTRPTRAESRIFTWLPTKHSTTS